MKKLLTSVICILLVAIFALFALASGESEVATQGSDAAEIASKSENTELGNYSVEIVSCRVAKDYADKPVVIVKYKFTNNDDDPASFMVAFDDNVYQNGVGLTTAIILDDDANYSSDNQVKEIKKGTSLDVEVAYTLNDATTDIEVEVKELFSFSDKIISKTFSIK